MNFLFLTPNQLLFFNTVLLPLLLAVILSFCILHLSNKVSAIWNLPDIFHSWYSWTPLWEGFWKKLVLGLEGAVCIYFWPTFWSENIKIILAVDFKPPLSSLHLYRHFSLEEYTRHSAWKKVRGSICGPHAVLSVFFPPRLSDWFVKVESPPLLEGTTQRARAKLGPRWGGCCSQPPFPALLWPKAVNFFESFFDCLKFPPLF